MESHGGVNGQAAAPHAACALSPALGGALDRCAAVSSAPGERFGEVCSLARRVFECPTVIASLLEGRRLAGLDAIFGEAVLATEATVVVPDTRADSRYADAFLVTAYPFVRFYAGAPIVLAERTIVGVLSLVDYRPRYDFGNAELASLASFARLAANEVARAVAERTRVQEKVQLERLAASASAALVEIDERDRIVGVNRVLERLTGAAEEDLVGAPAGRFLAGWERVVRHSRLLLDLVSGPSQLPPCLVDMVTVGGEVVPARAYAACWMEGAGIRHRLVLEPLV